MLIRWMRWGACFCAFGLLFNVAQATTFSPPPSNDVLPNPHRGYMLWGSNAKQDQALPANHHGASIYHVYIPWRMVETADQVFAWQTVENTYLKPITDLDPKATFVLRLIADYPAGANSGISHWYEQDNVSAPDDLTRRDYPLFLEQPPLSIGRNPYNNCDGDGPGIAPDWNDPDFINEATELVQAFGDQYDGDPRITAIQVGLLGLWGEWHQSGCASIGPENAVKEAVKTAYQNAFTQTPLQTRYPRNPDAIGTTFGFHEDYFPSFTGRCIYGMPFCSDDGDWSMEYGFQNVVPNARNNWQHNPISGEAPLREQKDAWINDTDDVITLLKDYHFSFIGPAGKHQESGNTSTLNRIQNHLGYRFQITQVTVPNLIEGQTATIRIDINQQGTAPAYFPMNIMMDWLDGSGQTQASSTFSTDIHALLPGESQTVSQAITMTLPAGNYALRLYIKQPNRTETIAFANGNRDTAQRVILGNVSITQAPAATMNAIDDVTTTAHDTQTTTVVGDNDMVSAGASLGSITNHTNGNHGNVSCNGQGAAASCTYTPNSTFAGTDAYTYTICLQSPHQNTCDTASVQVAVGPNAVDDATTVDSNSQQTFDVGSNDVHAPNSSFSVINATCGNTSLSGSLVRFNVGASTCSVHYQVCAPAPAPSLCDAAKLIVTTQTINLPEKVFANGFE